MRISTVDREKMQFHVDVANNYDADFWRLSQWWFAEAGTNKRKTPQEHFWADKLYHLHKSPAEAAQIIERAFRIFVSGKRQKVRFDVINDKGMPEAWSGNFPNHRKADDWFMKYGVKHEARGHNLVKVLVGVE